MQLVLATRNKDKIKEINNLLEDLPLTIMTFSDFLDFPEIEETGTTLEDNAILKARGICGFTGFPALADDSGLEIEYLNGAPGVFSSRFAGPGCSYDDNNNRLLDLLQGVPEEKRRARFRTIIAIAWKIDSIEIVEGKVDGFIAQQKVGESGFGYDPVFYYPTAGKTFAEMSLVEKSKISHRGRALQEARHLIIACLNRGNIKFI
jgi:XTP/dITP diphosphohydrolase